MFSLRSSMRLWGNSTKRMFHNRPLQNTSGQLIQKASEYFDRRRLVSIAWGTLYVSTVVYNQNRINKCDEVLDLNDKRLENMNKNVEEMERLDERDKELDKKMLERRGN